MDLPSLERLEAFWFFEDFEEATNLEIICVQVDLVGKRGAALATEECRKLTASEATELLAFAEAGSLVPTPLAKIRYRVAKEELT